MKQKKRVRKKKTVPRPLSKDREALVTALLNQVDSAPPQEIVNRIQDPLLATAFVDRLPLPDETALPFLKSISDVFKEKDVKKAVKRALFRLKGKGVRADGFADNHASESVYKPIKKDEPRCYVGPIDALGNRAVIIHFFESGKGIDVAMGMASDKNGIQQFVFDQMSRKRARELKADLQGMAGPLVEVPLSHGAMVLEDAFEIENNLGAEARADYLRARPLLLGKASLEDYSVNFGDTGVSHGEITSTDLRRLFENDLMASWLVPPVSLRPFMMEMQKVHESPIILSQTQKLNRIEEIKEKCVNTLFHGEERERFRKRLLEMAFFFLRSGNREYSRLCLEAAASIREKTSQFSRQPVLDFFVERSMQHYLALGSEASAKGPPAEDSETAGTPSPIILS